MPNCLTALAAFVVLATPGSLFGAESGAAADVGPALFGLRVEFILFGLTLLCVAVFHHHTFYVALAGLASLVILKLGFTEYDLLAKLGHEKMVLLNLFGLLLGFAVLARHFEESKFPAAIPNWLPGGWKGGFVLLAAICVLSSFLDNIAAAMIGGTIAMVVYKGNLHIGFLAAIVAASNAGGAGSVVGDTTTTMIWIDGKSPLEVLHAFYGSAAALAFFGVVAARQQDRLQPLIEPHGERVAIDWGRIAIVLVILAGAILANVYWGFPAGGVWIAILLGALMRSTPWQEVPRSLKGSVFLLSLVTCAALMPVHELPRASWQTAFGLGFLSAVFDNIPLTALALEQGGYDWGVIAYAVGFGGSMIWFGSSAGVALCNLFPQGRSVAAWLRGGWHVAVAYVLGFFVMLAAIGGWHPSEKAAPPAATAAPASAPSG